MNRSAALFGSFLFFWVGPFTVAWLVPWSITEWRARPPFLGAEGTRWLGGALFVVGLAVVLECFWRFAARGLGTPAPVAPTERLVVSGLYRFVRNPIYLGVLTVIVGEALWLGSVPLLAYAAFVCVAFTLFVRLYEEPTLRRTFGDSYETYRAHVPGWWPRLRRRQ